jgi:phosphotriesterase-related protein
VTTVKGAVSPDQLGITQPHEHIFVDLRCWVDVNADPKLARAPVSLGLLADLRRRDGQCEDNMILSSFDEATDELQRYRQFGGSSLVDVTLPGIGRDVKALRRISEKTGINVVCATGWYVESSQPAEIKQKPLSELTEIIIKELSEGIDETDVRAGVIGELGCSEPLAPSEEKVLVAAGRAQAKTKAPLTMHTALFDVTHKRHPKQARQELEILRKNDADLSKVYISHMDFTSNDLGYQERIMEDYGVTLDYDTFGQDQYYDNIFWGAGGITDKERITAMTALLQKGYEKQLMMSCDICEKIHLRKYGGWGYSHILEHIVPALKQNGIAEKQIETMLVDTPRRLLSR